jgi:hypothetical protein
MISIQDILKYVSDNTGLDVTDIITAKQLFDTLLVEKEAFIKVLKKFLI